MDRTEAEDFAEELQRRAEIFRDEKLAKPAAELSAGLQQFGAQVGMPGIEQSAQEVSAWMDALPGYLGRLAYYKEPQDAAKVSVVPPKLTELLNNTVKGMHNYLAGELPLPDRPDARATAQIVYDRAMAMQQLLDPRIVEQQAILPAAERMQLPSGNAS